MIKTFTTFLFFSLVFVQSFAQTNPQKKTFSKKDSLRGYLSSLRSGYDVKFYNLDITVDPGKKFIFGSNEITFKALSNLSKIQIDLFENMHIKGITINGQNLAYTREFNAVFVNFSKILQKDSIYRIRIAYEGNPIVAKNPPWDGGFTWTTDEVKNYWVGVSCQGIGASLWWPNKDHQSDEPDSMSIKVSVPNGLKDISNGRLRNTVDLGNGYTRFDWFVKNPINNYDVTVNIGNYDQFSENFQDLSCDFYVLPEHEEKARAQFLQVRTLLSCFLYYFGPYPFKEDGYKIVESPYLGMEHQSAIAYGNHFANGYLGSDLSGTGYGNSWDYILVHESAHEWFGNNITTKDIADMWVHEAFATYAEGLFVEFTQGYKQGQEYIKGLRSKVQNDRPCIGVYGVNNEGSEDMYFKGANMLNTIRSVINKDSVWFGILRKMNVVFRHQTINGQDLIDFICKESKLNLRPVFYQYLNTTQIPSLLIKRDHKGSISYRWANTQKGFNMPVDLIFEGYPKIRIFPEVDHWRKTSYNGYPPDIKIYPDTTSFYLDYTQVSAH